MQKTEKRENEKESKHHSKRYIVSCPICGKVILKSLASSIVELQCPKCSRWLTVGISGDNILLYAGQVKNFDAERLSQIALKLMHHNEER